MVDLVVGVLGQAERASGKASLLLADEPSMAAEDFAYYGEAVPSVFSFLGIGNSVLGSDASLHNPHFK